MSNPSPADAALAYPSVFTARENRIIQRALKLIEKKRLRDAPVLFCAADFERYLVLRFAGLTNEQGHVLYLDINHRLLAAETEFFGDQNGTPWDIRRVALRAITLGAGHVVFAHNHPSDISTPSDKDLQHLKWSEDALRPLKINLLDSFVVTSTRITSIKGYREHVEEMAHRARWAELERHGTERRAGIAATRAARRAAQTQENRNG